MDYLADTCTQSRTIIGLSQRPQVKEHGAGGGGAGPLGNWGLGVVAYCHLLVTMWNLIRGCYGYFCVWSSLENHNNESSVALGLRA